MKKFKKELVLFIILTLFLIPNIVNAEETGLPNNGWWIYDHTDNDDLYFLDNPSHIFIEKNLGSKHFTADRHIIFLDSGRTIQFIGYPSLPYADLIFYPSTNEETKNFHFRFNRYDQTDYHVFEGLGIWVNSSINGNYPTQTISGWLIWFSSLKTYLYKIDGLDLKKLHMGEYLTVRSYIEGIPIENLPRYLQSLTPYETYNDLKLFPSIILPKENEISMDIIVSNDTININGHQTNIENSTSNGYGIMIQYAFHNCERKSNVTIADVNFPTPLPINNKVEITNSDEDPSGNDNPEEHDTPVVKQKTCSDPTYNKDNYCACKKFECNENFTKDCTGKFINDMYQVIKIVVSVLLVVLTIIDMVKAMVAGNDEGIKKNIDTAKKRIIIVVVLLFGPALINLLLGLISNGNWSTCGIR